MKASWAQQAWATRRSMEIHEAARKNLDQRQVKTIWISLLFCIAGGVVMALVGFAVTRPLKRISTDMLQMAKLEFLSGQADMDDDDCELKGHSHRYFSIRGITRALSNLTSRSRSRTRTRFSSRRSQRTEDSIGLTRTNPTDPSSSSDTSQDERSQYEETRHDHTEREQDFETGEELSACFRLSTPKEVVDMRESFIYMVTGLKSFARYLDPDIMRMVVKSRRQAQLGMGKAEVTIFFSDIANFTTMAESLEPEVFMSMLTEYLDEMSKLIMSKQGVVGEFIGDAIMAWWNVPIDLGQEHTAMALDAALAQQNRLVELRETWHLQRLPDVRVRMGLVKGNVLAGNIGSSQRMKYGLVGDSVNLASRLEGLCKYYGVSIIIEQDAAFAPGVQSRFQLRLLDLVIVKGRTQPTELYQLVCEKAVLPEAFDSPEDLQFFIDAYSQIHRLYRLKSFDACASALHHYRQRLPDDVPSKMLLRRVETLLGEGVPADWTPVHILTEK
ncbi:Adenylate cyclase 1 (ATP pyrophosphate-lyase 1) (Adenylyl cyclase 1) [Durusdinium trenchii]|uniref:Adenylate cyclase 1 (ATP pyrophosphate-lyase 1) (Adenylyl cyclase 1) n=1 Tax=Durusdinium trenchii TaxID=1381693 RepID=A0ABP0R2F3_9DINO